MDPQLRQAIILRLTNQVGPGGPGKNVVRVRRQWAVGYVDNFIPNVRRGIRAGQPWRVRMLEPYIRWLAGWQRQQLEAWLVA
jgi:hypothetical protein